MENESTEMKESDSISLRHRAGCHHSAESPEGNLTVLQNTHILAVAKQQSLRAQAQQPFILSFFEWDVNVKE